MKNRRYTRIGLACLAALLVACQTVQTTQPGTVGVTRTQSMAVSTQQINAASAKAYARMLQEAQNKNQLNRDPAMVARVQGIAKRLIAQAGVFREDATRWNWEVNVIQSDQVNAFCMAGGKIGVYAGLISKLQVTDDELAAVLGHEIAHALREHVREQVSFQYAAQLPGMVLAVFTGSQLLSQLGDMVSNITLTLPRSRQAESEADEIGVELAARAGFDPNAAVTLWGKMNRLGGAKPPEFLSTHPSAATREQDLANTARLVQPLYQNALSKR